MAPLFAVGLAVIGCSESRVVIRGTQGMVQERRVLRQTEGIVIQGDMDVAIRLVAAAPAAAGGSRDTVVWIEGARDLVEYVEAYVDGADLRIRFRDGVRLDPVPKIEVQSTRLQRLVAGGSGTVRVEGLGIGLSDQDLCIIEASGSVDVRASGEVARLAVRQSGAADVHLTDLVAIDVDHSSVGSGDAWINASRVLRTSITGSSDVHVSGGATVQETVLGAGEVHRTLESAGG